MNRIILVFLLTSASFAVTGQTYKDEVRSRFTEYITFLTNKQYAKAIEYMNPEIFNMIPKEQMSQVLEMTFNNPDFDFQLGKWAIVSMNDKKTIKGQDYVKLAYSNELRMRFHAKDGKLPDTATAKKNLAGMFGQGNVKYDAKTQFYTIQATKNVVANAASGKKWTFIVIEERQKPLLEQFIPKELLD